MSRWLGLILTAALAALAGYWFAGGFMSSAGAPSAAEGEAEPDILYWVAPMDPNYRRDGPGKSPMGMDLVPVYADEAGGSGTVDIDPAVQHALGVRTEPARVRPLWRKVEATGSVAFDESRIRHIMVRTEGWVMASAVATEGERVAAGDLLFELYAPELVNAQKEYLQAARRGEDRLIRGAEEKLRALGMSPSEIGALRRSGRASERVRFVAPQAGVVTELGVREGMYVQPNTLALSLASLDSVWLLAEVFESQVPWIAEGQAAEARLKYLPDTAFSGEVDYVYPVLDPRTRNLRVRLRFENPGELMKPNMYAEVTIFGKLRPRALTIPREALIRGADRDRVAVALGEGRFEVREVLTGLESGGLVEVVAGLREGEEVVTSAQFLIDSEASLAGSILRLDPSRRAASGEEPPVSAVASGWIEAIEPEARRLRIAHGPIDALGWPAMNMVFEVEPQVDLSTFEVGQNIRFQLRQTDTGAFVITIASRQDAADEVLTPEKLERLEGAWEEDPWTAPGGVAGRGEIVRMGPEEGRLRMRHDPIPDLDWPAMTMNFRAAPDAGLDGLAPGDAVRFRLVRDGDAWVIEKIARVAGEEAPVDGASSTNDDGMDHDSMDHGGMDQDSMDHDSMDHGGMDHDAMDHGAMDHDSMDHDGMDHGSMRHDSERDDGPEQGAHRHD